MHVPEFVSNLREKSYLGGSDSSFKRWSIFDRFNIILSEMMKFLSLISLKLFESKTRILQQRFGGFCIDVVLHKSSLGFYDWFLKAQFNADTGRATKVIVDSGDAEGIYLVSWKRNP